MNKPRIPIRPQPVDLLIEMLGLISLLLLLFLPLIYLNRLPEEIPVHFDITGQPGAYKAKGAVWILPLTGLFFFISLSFLNRFPHVFTYPVRVTEENAERLYRIGTRTIRILKTLLVTLFLFTTVTIIYLAIGKSVTGMNIIIPGFIFLILLLTGVMIYKMIKNK